MAIDVYYSLVEEICLRCNIPNPVSMYANANLEVKGVNFSMFHGADIAPNCALLYSDFGKVPAQAKEAVLLRLLETNLYLFGPNTPAFCYNTQSRHIVLICRLPLSGATAVKVLALLDHIAGMAAQWRDDCYLQAGEAKTGVLLHDGSPAKQVAKLLEFLAGMTRPLTDDKNVESGALPVASTRHHNGTARNAHHLMRSLTTEPATSNRAK